MTTYKKIPLEVAEEDYDRVMKALKLVEDVGDRLDLVGNNWYVSRGSLAFGVKFRLGKESKA